MKALLVLILCLLAVPAMAGPNFAEIFAGFDLVRAPASYVTVTGDTLWFTKDAPNVNAALFAAQTADWFPPILVPYDSKGDGSLKKEMRPVRRVCLFSRGPFTFRPYVASQTLGTSGAAALTRCVADTMATGSFAGVGVGRNTDTYPCWAIVDYPDSIRIYEAGSDTVLAAFGY